MSRSLRVLILNTDYPEVLCWLYARHPGLENTSYAEQMQARAASLFGVADFYSSNLRKLGHEAWDIHANNKFMQTAWAKEYDGSKGVPLLERHSLRAAVERWGRVASRMPLRYLKPFVRPFLRSVHTEPAWFYPILEAQIRYYKPDVLLNQDMGISSRFLADMSPHFGLLVGQIASPLPDRERFDCYDLVISSLPNFVEYFRSRGISAELHRFAFEPNVLSSLANGNKDIPVSFVGTLSSDHRSRIQLLERVCLELGVSIWGRETGSLGRESSIRHHHMGQAWGIEMYEILHRSKITLNHHIGVADGYANNMRLFEATGVGCLLITDWKTNLAEIFKEGEEVIAYRTIEECQELLRYFLEHENEREAIARTGQKRTLQEHTYYHRMQELADIIHERL